MNVPERWPPVGGLVVIMTLNPQHSPAANDFNAPILPEDKARAKELFDQVAGTDREADYRAISARHSEKTTNRAAYQAFLAEIEAMFVAPPLLAAPVPEFLPVRPNSAPVVATSLDPEDEAEEDGQEEEFQDEETTPEAPATSKTPIALGLSAVLVAPPSGSGLISQLTGMLSEGGQVTFTLMRLGEEVTIGIAPKPHGTEESVPLIVTNTPAYFDEHLVAAMQPYAQARRDVYAECQAAASKQLAPKPKPETKMVSSAPKTPKGPKTHVVTISAAEGTVLTASVDGKALDVKVGENTVPQGTVTFTARHELLGEVSKTLSVFGAKAHDFTAQQGASITFEATPPSAAITAVNGEVQVAVHGKTFLGAGIWTVTAEADGFEPSHQQITVVAGKAQTVVVTLKMEQSLF